jgi:hypothetical protein
MELFYTNFMYGTIRGNTAYELGRGVEPGDVQIAMEKRAKQLCAQMCLLIDPAGGKEQTENKTALLWKRPQSSVI